MRTQVLRSIEYENNNETTGFRKEVQQLNYILAAAL